MAFEDAPGSWLDSWSEDGTDITVPIATFPELTADEADASTGDIRKVVWAILKKFYDEWNGRATADRPTKWTSSMIISTNATTGVVTNIFTNTIYTSVLTQEVVDES
jgi:hypothetical protein